MPSRRGSNRLVRTMLLGIVALAAFCWVLVRYWDIEPAEILGYITTSALLVAVIAFFAIGGAALLRWLRRWRDR